jgi:hypothetical protein
VNDNFNSVYKVEADDIVELGIALAIENSNIALFGKT